MSILPTNRRGLGLGQIGNRPTPCSLGAENELKEDTQLPAEKVQERFWL